MLANREQAERLRETQLPDFYAPVTAKFVADPRRTDEPALDVSVPRLVATPISGPIGLDIPPPGGRKIFTLGA